jgi:hypothetical protein
VFMDHSKGTVLKATFKLKVWLGNKTLKYCALEGLKTEGDTGICPSFSSFMLRF